MESLAGRERTIFGGIVNICAEQLMTFNKSLEIYTKQLMTFNKSLENYATLGLSQITLILDEEFDCLLH